MTDSQKHASAYYLMNYAIIITADFEKSNGRSIDDMAKHMGELFKTTWNPNESFNGFVKGVLKNWELFRTTSDPKMQIIKQTDEIFQFKTPLNINNLYLNEAYKNVCKNVSAKELLSIYETIFKTIADYLGYTYQQKLLDNGNWIELTITK
jgi:hypothetical protein